ncbi:MAG: RNA polymerase sigma factor [Paludibacteraceae bacterium]
MLKSSFNKEERIVDNEQRLIAGCKRGESWARKEVYEKYSTAMMSLCVRYTADYEQAKDVVQDGFVKLFTKIHQFEGRGSFGGWIRQIFVNTSLEHISKNKIFKTNVQVDYLSEYAEEFDYRAFEVVSADDLMECISELPFRSRTVFNMYAIEGFSHAEIAERLGITEATSRTHFSRARKSLQESVLKLMKK